MSQTRAYDCLYDSTYTVSGARDHYREQSRAAGFQIERVPEYQNFFSELPTHPSQAFRFKAADKLPGHVNREYAPPSVGPAELAYKSSAARISGANRYKHFRRPLLPTGSIVPQQRAPQTGPVAVGGASMGAGTSAAAAGYAAPASAADVHQMEAVHVGQNAMTIGTQSDYRESEAQTQPYTPDFVIPEVMSEHQRALDEKYHLHGQPELLTIEHMKFHGGLPPGLAEVEMIEKQRAKRAFDDTLPPLHDDSQMPLRQAMMEEWEEKEWDDREKEIKEVQEERLEVMRRAILHREEKIEGGAAVRIDDMRAAKLADKQKAFAAIQKRRIKALRTLAQARKLVEGVPKTDIIDDYGSYASKVYAPKARDGRFPEMVPKGRVIDPKPFEPSTYKGMLELESAMPAETMRMKTKRPPIAVPHTATERQAAHVANQLDHITGLLEESADKGGRGFGDAWPCPTSGVETEVTKRKRLAAKKLDRPETPEAPEPDAAVARARAAGLLQRLLRGRAVQNSMYEGKERRLELIRELQLDEEPAASVAPDALNALSRTADAVVGAAVAETLGILSIGDPAEQAALMGEMDARRAAQEAAAEARAEALRDARLAAEAAEAADAEMEAAAEEFAGQDQDELEAAATRIQARHRGRQARKDAGARKVAAAAVEEEEELPDLSTYDEGQIAKIQARARGKAARKAAKPAPVSNEARALKAADLVVEKILTDLDLEEMLADPGAEGAATRIQAIQRGRKSRRSTAAMRAGGAGRREAIKAQAQELPPLDSFTDADQENIVKIQAAARGRASRKARAAAVEASPLLAGAAEELPDLATFDEGQITKIQARARGKAARKQVAAKRASTVEEAEAEIFNLADYDSGQITKIQARARGKKTRKEMAAKRAAALAIPEDEELPDLATFDEAQIAKIQARARGKAARKRVKAMKAEGASEEAIAEAEAAVDEAKADEAEAEAVMDAVAEELPDLATFDEGQITKIQARARGKAARKQVAAKRASTGAAAEEEEELPDLSTYDEGQIAKIQARARGKAARKQVAAKRASTGAAAEEELPDLATFDEAQIAKIQARARGKAARKRVKAMKAEGASEEAIAEAEAAVDEAKADEAEAEAVMDAVAEELPDLATFDEGQITKIQARARGKAARKQVAAKRASTGAAAEEELPDLATFDEAQIAKIQARARGKAARKRVKAMKAEGASEEAIAEAEAAVDEAKADEAEAEAVMDAVAEELPDLSTFDEGQITKIQARARGKAARKQVAAIRAPPDSDPDLAAALSAPAVKKDAVAKAEAEAAAEERAAIKIQSSARGMLVRKERREGRLGPAAAPAPAAPAAEVELPDLTKLSSEDEEYVVKIQAGIRGHLARKEVSSLKSGAAAAAAAEVAAEEGAEGGEDDHADEEAAAIRIQAATRGRVARKQVAEKRAAIKAAKEQAERGEDVTVDVSTFTPEEQQSIVRIQSVARGRAARKRVEGLKGEAAGAEGGEGEAAAEGGTEAAEAAPAPAED